MAASRLPSILPAPGPEEALEVARIASACGRLANRRPGSRPLRAPHHTISPAGLVGGGNPPRPGEATLAHRGVLFLDELCEFRRDALESLRAPLETGWVSIARAGSWQRLPCRFMLVAAANPCPCGRGEADPECSCSPLAIQRYQARLSGALADRIDILAAIRQPSAEEIGGEPGEPSDSGPSKGRGRPGAPGRSPRAGALQRGDDARPRRGSAGSARPPRRCSPTPTREASSAAAPTTASCGWRRRSPTSPAAMRSSASRWRRPCSCGGGTTSDARLAHVRPACAGHGCWPDLAPYIEKVATGSPGSRSPELLRLSNEDLVAAVAPRAESKLLEAVEASTERSLAAMPVGGRLLGLLPPRLALSGGPARRAPTRPGR